MPVSTIISSSPVNYDIFLPRLEAILAAREPKARILCASWDEVLLRTRHMLLEREGYDVASAIGIAALQHCREGNFDIFVLGHSIPTADQQQLAQEFRKHCTGAIISLRRGAGDPLVEQADYHLEADPGRLLQLISRIVQGKGQPADWQT